MEKTETFETTVRFFGKEIVIEIELDQRELISKAAAALGRDRVGGYVQLDFKVKDVRDTIQSA